MTINDDMCDFCGAYIDPIGGDLASLIQGVDGLKLWDGACEPGLMARWDRFSTPQLETLLESLNDRITNDPIDWSGEADKDKDAGERLRHRLSQLNAHDFHAQVHRMLDLRNANSVDSDDEDPETYTEVAQDLENLSGGRTEPPKPGPRRRKDIKRCEHDETDPHEVFIALWTHWMDQTTIGAQDQMTANREINSHKTQT